jgi:hypothetical protein
MSFGRYILVGSKMEPRAFTGAVPIFTRLRFVSAFAISSLRRMRRSALCVGATAGPPPICSGDIRCSAGYPYFRHTYWRIRHALWRTSPGLHLGFFRLRSCKLRRIHRNTNVRRWTARRRIN